MDTGLFDPSLDVNSTTDTITITGHGFSNNEAVVYRSLIYDPASTVELSPTEEASYTNFYTTQGTEQGLSGVELDAYVTGAIATVEASRTAQYQTLNSQYGSYGDATIRPSATP